MRAPMNDRLSELKALAIDKHAERREKAVKGSARTVLQLNAAEARVEAAEKAAAFYHNLAKAQEGARLEEEARRNALEDDHNRGHSHSYRHGIEWVSKLLVLIAFVVVCGLVSKSGCLNTTGF